MKKVIRRLGAAMSALLILCMASAVSAAVVTGYGAGTVKEDQNLSLERMLTIAMEDEYLAAARYKAAIGQFGKIRPFVNIERATRTHIMILKPLLRKYHVSVPENAAARYVSVPDNTLQAMKEAIEAERLTLRMHALFLKRTLPNDVQLAFTYLSNASENHISALTRGISRLETDAARSPGRRIGIVPETEN
jgi:hypothetical protein